ncbi:DUF6712 family protein [Chitinophaga cymbidii]|uniref:Uncharacterized protein n=1 Tax=Chitinophaga cymbidii TaxID=1096750 RepID=A0A512RIR8_9BACT|nr:hypothetical protein [Chitinophaga cymbidii]GEP95572.1 hypothetical protein CCY01nite_18320 [Chitinophaga cymbidii]
MSKKILFLSEKYIKENSFVSDNVNPKDLLPTVKAVQDIYIHPMLGTALYNKLQDLVMNQNTTPIPADYVSLLDYYILDALLWYALADMPIPLQMKLVNKGVVQRADATIAVSSTSDRKELHDYCKSKAEWYAQRAINYLRANTDKYPDYIDPGTGCDVILPDRTQFSTGIFLGASAGRRRRNFGDKYQ